MQVTSANAAQKRRGIEMLEELAGAAGTVATTIGPAIVRIETGRRGGCGIVVGRDQVLTNAHNVNGGSVPIVFADGRRAEGEVAGVDVDADLAIVRVETGEVEAPAFADAATPVGLPVFAVAATRHGPRVSFGIVSAVGQAFRGPRGRRIAGSIEHTAPLAAGSSGSALVDASGHLVGVSTNRVGNGFYLALPVDETLRRRIDVLASGATIERPRLGVAIAPAWVARRMRAAVGLPPLDGLLVREVEPGSAAAAAGVEVGDLIVAVAGTPVGDADALVEALDRAEGTLAIDLVRGTEDRSVEVRFEES